MAKKVCFLGYNREQTCLINIIENAGYEVTEIDSGIDDFSSYDMVISFGYRFPLTEEQLRTSLRPVLNLHISYLPYNRGSHPNFWAWIEKTPVGVSIHEIDHGIDTGPICYQRLVDIPQENNTFADTYTCLIRSLEDLFIENCQSLLRGEYKASIQQGCGSFHRKQDLPDWMTDWDMQIADAVQKYYCRLFNP